MASSKSNVYLLTRMLSPYTHEDLILGVFTDENIAEEKRKEYIEMKTEYDEHRYQGYMFVNLENDVVIDKLELDAECELEHNTKSPIYVLLSCCSAMGQVYRTPVCVSCKLDNIIAKSNELHEAEKVDDKYFLSEWMYLELPLNTLVTHNGNVRLINQT